MASRVSKNLYKVLGVSSKATDAEIKSAFRNLSKEYHPDTTTLLNKDEATKKFQEINEAYRTLSKSRSDYDMSLNDGHVGATQFKSGEHFGQRRTQWTYSSQNQSPNFSERQWYNPRTGVHYTFRSFNEGGADGMNDPYAQFRQSREAMFTSQMSRAGDRTRLFFHMFFYLTITTIIIKMLFKDSVPAGYVKIPHDDIAKDYNLVTKIGRGGEQELYLQHKNNPEKLFRVMGNPTSPHGVATQRVPFDAESAVEEMFNKKI